MNIVYLASHKILILNLSVKCSLTMHFLCFLPNYLLLQSNLCSTKALRNRFMVMFGHYIHVVKLGKRLWFWFDTGEV